VPGPLSRRDSLTQAASTAIRLILGVIPMLVVAGLVEGLVSPTDLPVAAKFVTSGALLTILAIYLMTGGTREAAHQEQQDC
jgi:uncharacterized membrane protein SpoIIM required for sporulation